MFKRKKNGLEKKRPARKQGTRKYGQIKRKHAKKGIQSCCVAIVSLCVIAALVAITYDSKGKAAGYIGGLGMSTLLISVVGLGMGIKGFKEREKNYLTCKIGVVLNSIVFIGLIVFFVGGLV